MDPSRNGRYWIWGIDLEEQQLSLLESVPLWVGGTPGTSIHVRDRENRLERVLFPAPVPTCPAFFHADPGWRAGTCGVHAFPHFWCYRAGWRRAVPGWGTGRRGRPSSPPTSSPPAAGLRRADPNRQWGAPAAVPATQPDPARGGAHGHLGGGGDTGAHRHRVGGGGDTRRGR